MLPWGSPLREAMAWGRSQGHLRGTSPLQGGYCRHEGGDLRRESSNQTLQVGDLSPECFSFLATGGFYSYGARASCG